jgi:hypothetical protein
MLVGMTDLDEISAADLQYSAWGQKLTSRSASKMSALRHKRTRVGLGRVLIKVSRTVPEILLLNFFLASEGSP